MPSNHITIEISDEQAERLQREAARRAISVEALVQAGVVALLEAEPSASVAFEDALEHVLRKNAELYRRLA